MVISGVVITLAGYFLLTRWTSPTRAFLLAAVVATSGTVLLAAGPVQSDGVALAIALSALALAVRPSLSWKTAALAGFLVGAAVAVKSLHILPIVIVVVLVLAYRLAWGRLGIVIGVATLVVMAASMPFGLEAVWDQYVLFHLAKDNSADVLANLSNSGQFLARFDLPLVAVVVGGLIAAVWGRRERGGPSPEGAMHWMPITWLAVTAVLLLGFTTIDDGFVRTLAFLVPPLVLVVARYERLPIRALLGVVVVGAILQVAFTGVVLEEDSAKEAVITEMSSIGPGTLVVTDDPGLGWSANRLSHPGAVDPSYARFQTGYLTVSDIEASLADPQTCILAIVSGRFDRAGLIPPDDYTEINPPGGRLYRRSTC